MCIYTLVQILLSGGTSASSRDDRQLQLLICVDAASSSFLPVFLVPQTTYQSFLRNNLLHKIHKHPNVSMQGSHVFYMSFFFSVFLRLKSNHQWDLIFLEKFNKLNKMNSKFWGDKLFKNLANQRKIKAPIICCNGYYFMIKSYGQPLY